MHPTQSGNRMSQGWNGVRKVAKGRKQERFTALLHYVTVDLLRDSFFALKRQAAPGVDGVTWQEYETGLEDRLIDLHSRAHRGAYWAQPSRRVYIPKPDGRQRPLGIAALEDKIVQQAVVTILNQIYEVDFKGFSYGFRQSFTSALESKKCPSKDQRSPRSATISAAIDPGILESRLRTSSRPGPGLASCSSRLILSMYSTSKLDRPGVVALTTLTTTCSCSLKSNGCSGRSTPFSYTASTSSGMTLL